MRTALLLAAGLMALAALVIYSRFFIAHYPSATHYAVYAFLALWLAATGFNLWVGIAHAGYSLREELPIMLLLFGVPAAAALIVRWKLA